MTYRPTESGSFQILLLSDVHYACAAERLRGDYEARTINHPLLRVLLGAYRRHVWCKDPLSQNRYLTDFLAVATQADLCLGLGDYTCDSAFIGVADDAAMQSASICLNRLRNHFGDRFRGLIGDHDLGKQSLSGRVGGMRLESWQRCCGPLQLESVLHQPVGKVHLVGMNSSLLTLPACWMDFEADQRAAWLALRDRHLQALKGILDGIPGDHRILFFMHDPTGLAMLLEHDWVRRCLPRLDGTWVGHLHSPWVFKASRWLSGMPRIRCMGNAVTKLSAALQQRHLWEPFKVRLVPAPGGIEIAPQGGYGDLRIDPEGKLPPDFCIRPLAGE